MVDNRFEALFQYASIGILVANENGVIEMANNFLLTQFGYDSSEELIGKEVEMLIPSRYTKKHQQHRSNYNKQPGPRTMGTGRDLFAIKKDGSEFPVEVSLSNYNLGGSMHIIAFVIDITTRKEIEKSVIEHKQQIEELNEGLEKKVALRTVQLQEAMQDLEQSKDELSKALDKEKELGDLKSRFVSMASHEFRTPLSTILSSASLLAKYAEKEEQEKREKHIDRIKSSVNNLTGILNEFLSIGKIEDGKIEVKSVEFNVKDFISKIIGEISGIKKKAQEIVYDHEGNEMVNLDESLLRNIIINLLSNAIKFTAEDGIINIHSSVQNDTFVLTIKDNGLGISTEDQQHLFERFFRASNVTNIQGTGLGLHIVGKYVELMKGTIDFTSELEKGTAFTITFNHNFAT
ncbi:MAG: PAS domain S-box protein [Bacteroidetes bacterium]|nr:PAS domain S-box protein [Bacteroidota bacterium]